MKARVSIAHPSTSPRSIYGQLALLVVTAVVLLVAAGCTGIRQWAHQGFKVGPDYCAPPAPVADHWIDYENPDVSSSQMDYGYWWSVFNDPQLSELIDRASGQNLTLQSAGMRILQARSRLAITRGNFFPQVQRAYADFDRRNMSANSAVVPPTLDFDFWDAGFESSWELDFWGRYRRAIERDDALLNASIENYDNVLVVLQAELANAYIQYRTLQERLAFANQNVKLQRRTLEIVETNRRNEEKNTTDFEVAQAKENLAFTEALVPSLESGIRQAGNAICVLLGEPPRDLSDELGTGPIPATPEQIFVGIPAELLRRRPDVRRAERLAAARSATIGIAESDFYPQIAISGYVGVESEKLSNLFESASFTGAVGPSLRWNILNYGRILNNVRQNEAAFYGLVLDYQNAVLTANREVEDAIVSFLQERKRAASLNESASQAQRAVEVVDLQWREGQTNFLPVVYMQQVLAERQDQLAASRGVVANNIVAVYRGLGGGWQSRLNVGPLVNAPGMIMELDDAAMNVEPGATPELDEAAVEDLSAPVAESVETLTPPVLDADELP